MHSFLCVFPSLKNLFSSSLIASWQIFDRFSFIEPFFLLFLTDLDGISIYRDFWVSSRQILNSFFDPSSQFSKPSIWLIDSRQLLNPSRCFCRRQILDSTLTNSFMSRFSARQILRSIELRFLYIGWMRIRSHFFTSLFRHNFFSFLPNNSLSLLSFYPCDFRSISSLNPSVYILQPFIYMHSCF